MQLMACSYRNRPPTQGEDTLDIVALLGFFQGLILQVVSVPELSVLSSFQLAGELPLGEESQLILLQHHCSKGNM